MAKKTKVGVRLVQEDQRLSQRDRSKQRAKNVAGGAIGGAVTGGITGALLTRSDTAAAGMAGLGAITGAAGGAIRPVPKKRRVYSFEMTKRSDPFEISKVGSPKSRGTTTTIIRPTPVGQNTYGPDTIEAKSKGKSLVLRRQKQEFHAYSSKRVKDGDYALVQRRMKLASRAERRRLQEKLDANGGKWTGPLSQLSKNAGALPKPVHQAMKHADNVRQLGAGASRYRRKVSYAFQGTRRTHGLPQPEVQGRYSGAFL